MNRKEFFLSLFSLIAVIIIPKQLINITAKTIVSKPIHILRGNKWAQKQWLAADFSHIWKKV
jgi:hypothetical protein